MLVTLASLFVTSAASTAIARRPAVADAHAQLYAFDAVGAVKGLPGTVRTSLRQFRTGVSGMWRNYGEARRVRKRAKASGEPFTYPELVLLKTSGEDTSKFLQVGVMWMAAPELVPAVLYFFPRSVPSTFESEQGRRKRYNALSRNRAKALVKLLTKLEEQAAKQGGRPVKQSEAALQEAIATQALRGRAEGDTLRPLTPFVLDTDPPATAKESKRRQRQSLKKVPVPLLNAACGIAGLSAPPIFGMRRGGLTKHLVTLAEEDAALSSGGLQHLSEDQLREACFDRGMGLPEASAADMRKQLQRWLELTDQIVLVEGKQVEPQPQRMRLAALAAFGVAAARKAPQGKLPRLLFAP